MADRGSRDERESREDRDGKLSAWRIGERPEMSKDRLYDSKDSREIEKGSCSARVVRWWEEFVDLPAGDLCQKDFFSGGEGYEVLVVA
jgi:hypothetical protein